MNSSSPLDRLIRTILSWVLFSSPLFFCRYTHDVFLIPKRAWVLTWLAVVLFLFVLSFFKKQTSEIKASPVFIPGILLCIYICFGYLRSPDTYYAGIELKLIISYALAYFLFRRFSQGAGVADRFIKIMTASAFIACVYAWVQHIGLDPLKWELRGQRENIFSTFGYPQFLSAYLLLVLPLSIYTAISQKTRPKKLLYFFFVFVIFSTIFLAASLSAWLTVLLIAVLAIFFFNKKLPKKKIAVVLISLLLIIVFFHENIPAHIKDIFNKSYALQHRFLFYRIARHLFYLSPWIGHGPGSFQYLYPDGKIHVLRSARLDIPEVAGHDWLYPHAVSDPLEYLVEFGVVGMFLLLLFFLRYFMCAYRHCVALTTDKDKLRAMCLVLSLVGILFYSLANFPFHTISTGFPFFCVAGILAGGFEQRSRRPGSFTLSSITKLLIVDAAGILLVMSALFFIRPFIGDLYYNKAFKLAKAHSYKDSLSFYIKASRWVPNKKELDFRIGEALFRMGLYDPAIQALSACLDGFRKKETYHCLGESYRAKKNIKAALIFYDLALELDPFYDKSRFQKATLLASTGEINDAIGEYLEYIKRNDDSDAWYNLGICYFLNNDVPGARQAWQNTVSSQPGHVLAKRSLKLLKDIRRK